MNIFQRAAKNLPLSPAERALLKLGEHLIVAALLTALPAAFLYLSNQMATHPSGFDAKTAAVYVVGLLLSALSATLVKYIKSNFQGPIADAAVQLIQQADEYALHFGGVPNDIKFEPDITGVPTIGSVTAPTQ